MFKFFRQIRKKLITDNRFTKYLLYAIGEIVLVVIGILIALQINNSNQKRLDAEALSGYLNSIAQNLESDLKKAEKINEARLDIFPRISMVRRRMSSDYYQVRRAVYGEDINEDYLYSIENVDFMSGTINDSWGAFYLTPDLSGFESLKSSGFLRQLQGTDLEKLLFAYYNQVNELIVYENNYNAGMQESFNDFLGADMPGTYAFFNPGTQDWNTIFGGRFPEMIDDILEHPALLPVWFWPYELIIKYDNLIIVGRALKQMIQNGEEEYTTAVKQKLSKVYDEYSDAPYAKVMRSGYVTNGYTYTVASAINNQGVNLQFNETYATMQFYGEPWAVGYFYVGTGVPDPSRTKDFSEFTTLRLRLRGVKGGENIQIALKDSTNPTDGSETKVPLTLTDQWQDYEIPLASFAPTNLKELFIVASIIVMNQACAIELQEIEFL